MRKREKLRTDKIELLYCMETSYWYISVRYDTVLFNFCQQHQTFMRFRTIHRVRKTCREINKDPASRRTCFRSRNIEKSGSGKQERKRELEKERYVRKDEKETKKKVYHDPNSRDEKTWLVNQQAEGRKFQCEDKRLPSHCVSLISSPGVYTVFEASRFLYL